MRHYLMSFVYCSSDGKKVGFGSTIINDDRYGLGDVVPALQVAGAVKEKLGYAAVVPLSLIEVPKSDTNGKTDMVSINLP